MTMVISLFVRLSHLYSLRDQDTLVCVGLRRIVTVALLRRVQIFLLTYLLTQFQLHYGISGQCLKQCSAAPVMAHLCLVIEISIWAFSASNVLRDCDHVFMTQTQTQTEFTSAGLKPLCPHHKNTLQYTNLVKLFIQNFTLTSGSL